MLWDALELNRYVNSWISVEAEKSMECFYHAFQKFKVNSKQEVRLVNQADSFKGFNWVFFPIGHSVLNSWYEFKLCYLKK